jgi:hypothetical protein
VGTKWQHTWFTTGTHDDVNVVLAWAMDQANDYGQLGWELVNFQLRENVGDLRVVAMTKQPLTKAAEQAAGRDSAQAPKKKGK